MQAILVVDSAHERARSLRTFLGTCSAVVDHADDIDMALAKLKQQPFDALLLRDEMDSGPTTTGVLEKIRRIHQVRSNTTVVPYVDVVTEEWLAYVIKGGAQDGLAYMDLESPEILSRLKAATLRQQMLYQLLRSHEDEIHSSRHDPLTGLPNRCLFQDRLEQAIASTRRNQAKMALMFVDVDHFKKINDELGHSAGDAMLKEVARRLKMGVRKSDTVARLAGDEFTIIVNHIERYEGVTRIVTKVLQALAMPFYFDEQEVEVTCSIGVALCPDDATDIQSLFNRADEAMYHAKREGRNRCCLYGGLSIASEDRETYLLPASAVSL